MAEARIMAEGTLRSVQASGSGRTWATAAAAPTSLLGYVQSFSYSSAQTISTIMERGVPDHHKVTNKERITVDIEYIWTGSALNFLTSSGTTVPLVHLEHRASAAELGAATAFYHQFHGCALMNRTITEAAEGNRVREQYVALAMNGPTASGYLA